MVASTRAYSRSGSSETASNNRCQTFAFTQSRKRVKMLFQCPNEGGRSRQGLPVRTTHKTAPTNRRLSLPLRPGSPGLPRQRGSIFAHWASVSTKRSIRGVNHSPARMKIVNPNTPYRTHRNHQDIEQAMPNLTGTARVLDRTQILRQVFDRHAPFLRYREDTASRISTGQASKISCVAPGGPGSTLVMR